MAYRQYQHFEYNNKAKKAKKLQASLLQLSKYNEPAGGQRSLLFLASCMGFCSLVLVPLQLLLYDI